MKLPAAFRQLSPVGWLVSVIVAVAVLVGAWWIIIGGPAHDRRKAAEAEAHSILDQAKAASARDAAGVVVEGGQRDDSIDAQAKDAENEIRNAPEDQRGAIALARLCMHDSARNSVACRQLRDPSPR